MLKKVEKFNNIITFERKPKQMLPNPEYNEQDVTSNSNDSETCVSPSNNTTNNGKNHKAAILNFIVKFIEIFGGICAILIVLYGVVANVMIPISSHEDDIAEIKDELVKINDALDDLTKSIYLNSASITENKSGNLAEAISVKFNPPYFPEMGLAINDYILAKPRWTSNKQKIANALGNENIEFTSGELQNKKIAATYLEKGKEIYFLGQYNEYNQWHGECILNVYENYELSSIIEGIYNNGKLESYKRISCDVEGQWKVSERTCHKKDNGEAYTSGETWDYEKNEAFTQQIDPEDFDETDFLTIEYILNYFDPKLIGYYKGRTSNERFNDETGDACMVKYNKNGDVRYLYVGKIVNGKEHDASGEAWFVSLGDKDDSHYYYYKGVFSNGNHDPASPDWKPLTQTQINSIINPDIYDCSLQGLVEDPT